MKTEVTAVSSSFDELNLSILICRPEETPKAVVQIAHGMCEHKERYLPFMEFLCNRGYACIIHDHRGHGASVKRADDLGYMYSGGSEGIIEDIKTVNRHAASMFPESLIFLFGHSMGSLAVRCFAKRHDGLINGLIVCGSPSRNPAAGAGKALTKIISIIKGDRHRPAIIQKMAFNSFNKNFTDEGENAWLSTDRSVVQAYNASPLCGYTFTANGFIGLVDLMTDCYDSKGWRLSRHEMPVLFIAGENDPCITGEKQFTEAVEFFRKAGYENTSSRLYEGMRHEILNENGKETVWNDILSFFDRHN
ncbi:MAG: alpha/beta fold hydrolase [Bacteroidales bacterium]|nr:alpha/beta fold hydrolase [Bacteroidales bacterium]